MKDKTHEPVLVSMSILAALQILFGGVGGVTYLSDNEVIAAICAVGMVAVGAAQVGLQFYVRGQVVPLESVSERVVNGTVVAGPANDLVVEGTPVREVGDLPPGEKELIQAVEELKESAHIYPASHGEQDGTL